MTETSTIGDRVAFYRRRRGQSQEVLAGLIGRTEDWLSRVENNKIDLDRLPVIRRRAGCQHRRPANHHRVPHRGAGQRNPARPRRQCDVADVRAPPTSPSTA